MENVSRWILRADNENREVDRLKPHQETILLRDLNLQRSLLFHPWALPLPVSSFWPPTNPPLNFSQKDANGRIRTLHKGQRLTTDPHSAIGMPTPLDVHRVCTQRYEWVCTKYSHYLFHYVTNLCHYVSNLGYMSAMWMIIHAKILKCRVVGRWLMA